MIDFTKVSPVIMLIAKIKAAQMDGADYIDTAHTTLLEMRLSKPEVKTLLQNFKKNHGIIHAVFKTNQIGNDIQYYLDILTANKFDEMLCISAGEVYTDSKFIAMMIDGAYQVSSRKACKLATHFKKNLCPETALALQLSTNNDPNMSMALRAVFHKYIPIHLLPKPPSQLMLTANA